MFLPKHRKKYFFRYVRHKIPSKFFYPTGQVNTFFYFVCSQSVDYHIFSFKRLFSDSVSISIFTLLRSVLPTFEVNYSRRLYLWILKKNCYKKMRKTELITNKKENIMRNWFWFFIVHFSFFPFWQVWISCQCSVNAVLEKINR